MSLGRGLGALLDDSAAAAVSYGQKGASEQVLPLSELVPSEVQPRRHFDDEALKSLANSIRSQGIIQPLLVRPLANGKFEIIAGERRWRASKEVGLKHVPVIIRELDDGKALEIALVENVQRADLNPIDEAAGYLRLVNEFNYTHEDMARVTGKSRSHITNLLRLLSLPDNIKSSVIEGLLSMGHARALLALSEDEGLQLRVARRVIKKGLSVRETEDLVRQFMDPNKPRRGRRQADVATRELEQRVGSVLGMKVNIQPQDEGGSIRIHYKDGQQLKALLGKIGV